MGGEHEGADFINIYPEKPLSDMTEDELDAIAMRLAEWGKGVARNAPFRESHEPYVPIPGVSPAINALGAEAWAKHPERRARWRAEREALAEQLKRDLHGRDGTQENAGMAEDDDQIPLHDGEPLTEDEAHELSEKLLRHLARTGEQENAEPAEGSEGE